MIDGTRTGKGRVVYLPHGGGPLPLLGDPAHRELIDFLARLPQRLIEPRAILVVSAHWEAACPTLTGAARPGLLYDYSGFPPESYEIEYPAAGHPELAKALSALLGATGLPARLDDERGFDHGLFVPLKLMYPDAEIPCIELSLVHGLDPKTHIELGRAISSLLDEDLLVVGSGASFHNMQAFGSGDQAEHGQAVAFDDWLVETCTSPGISDAQREERLASWETAPHARFCHPREEHLIPLHVCFGAGATAGRDAELAYRDDLFGRPVSGFVW